MVEKCSEFDAVIEAGIDCKHCQLTKSCKKGGTHASKFKSRDMRASVVLSPTIMYGTV